MSATDFAPIRPLSREPFGESVSAPDCQAALLAAVRGATLGTHDLATLRRMSTLDSATVRTIVSLLERVRRAGQCEALEAANQHLVAAGHHTSAEIARARAHDIRVGRWLLDDTRAGGQR